ncbi:MAG: hypothetical protein IMZ43_07680 [Thermoplasmata archaeon]|nr:hypothetical protein [Thermoplasmata archaeon]
MKQNYPPRRFLIKRMLLITIIMSLIGMGIQTLSNKNIPLLIVSAQQDAWSLTLKITAGPTIILGGSPNASDGQDDLDLPEPPAPPTLPSIRAWFATPLSIPYDKLLHEYKHAPSQRMEWNLSLIWIPEPGNTSSTTISISWDPTQAAKSTYDSFQLYENNTAVANMLTENSYSFPSNGTLQSFQIIGLSTSTNGASEQNDLPVLPILLGISVIVVVIIAFFLYKRKK